MVITNVLIPVVVLYLYITASRNNFNIKKTHDPDFDIRVRRNVLNSDIEEKNGMERKDNYNFDEKMSSEEPNNNQQINAEDNIKVNEDVNKKEGLDNIHSQVLNIHENSWSFGKDVFDSKPLNDYDSEDKNNFENNSDWVKEKFNAIFKPNAEFNEDLRNTNNLNEVNVLKDSALKGTENTKKYDTMQIESLKYKSLEKPATMSKKSNIKNKIVFQYKDHKLSNLDLNLEEMNTNLRYPNLRFLPEIVLESIFKNTSNKPNIYETNAREIDAFMKETERLKRDNIHVEVKNKGIKNVLGNMYDKIHDFVSYYTHKESKTESPINNQYPSYNGYGDAQNVNKKTWPDNYDYNHLQNSENNQLPENKKYHDSVHYQISTPVQNADMNRYAQYTGYRQVPSPKYDQNTNLGYDYNSKYIQPTPSYNQFSDSGHNQLLHSQNGQFANPGYSQLPKPGYNQLPNPGNGLYDPNNNNGNYAPNYGYYNQNNYFQKPNDWNNGIRDTKGFKNSPSDDGFLNNSADNIDNSIDQTQENSSEVVSGCIFCGIFCPRNYVRRGPVCVPK